LDFYPGERIDVTERRKFLAELSTIESDRHSTYDMMDSADPDKIICPVDERGNIRERFASHYSLYVNEVSEVRDVMNASMDPASWYIDMHPESIPPEETVVLVSSRMIFPDQEILTFYGDQYSRDYEIKCEILYDTESESERGE
jgi:hypothetical protein